MDDLIALGRDWGSWAGAALALAIALRTHASTSARTVRQLATWLDEARAKIASLERCVAELVMHRDQLAAEVERLMPFERRAQSLAAELRAMHAAGTAGGGAEQRAISLVREQAPGTGAEVIELSRAARREEG